MPLLQAVVFRIKASTQYQVGVDVMGTLHILNSKTKRQSSHTGSIRERHRVQHDHQVPILAASCPLRRASRQHKTDAIWIELVAGE
jgi:hypothetical protein